jgi:hypothetical protein
MSLRLPFHKTGIAMAETRAFDPFRYTQTIMNLLLGWGALSVAAGAGMLFLNDTELRWFGAQNCLWGAIDMALAFYLKHRSLRQLQSGLQPQSLLNKIRRLLFINGLIDFAYIGVGVALCIYGQSEVYRGNGLGVVVQGGFLLFFDWINFAITSRT